MKLYKAGTFEVNYDNAHQYLLLTCKPALDQIEFREGVLCALRFAEESTVKQWIFDLSEIGNLPEEEQVWLDNYLFPRLMIRLGTANYIAFILSEQRFEELLSDAGKYGLQSYNSFIIMNTFHDMQGALYWINSQPIQKAS